MGSLVRDPCLCDEVVFVKEVTCIPMNNESNEVVCTGTVNGTIIAARMNNCVNEPLRGGTLLNEPLRGNTLVNGPVIVSPFRPIGATPAK